MRLVWWSAPWLQRSSLTSFWRPCHSNNVNLCEPYEFAVNGAGHAYDVNHAERTYSTATCEGGYPVMQSLPAAMARVGVSSIAGQPLPEI